MRFKVITARRSTNILSISLIVHVPVTLSKPLVFLAHMLWHVLSTVKRIPRCMRRPSTISIPFDRLMRRPSSTVVVNNLWPRSSNCYLLKNSMNLISMDRLSLKTQARTTVSCLQWFAVHLVDHQTHERRLKKEKKNAQYKQVRQLELLSVAHAGTLGI